MARTARHAGRKAALAGLLTGSLLWLTQACASIQAPPGGPPDVDPPLLVTFSPDSGAVLPEFDDAVEFRFDEVITEASLENFFFITPRHEEIRVSWKRKRVTVRPRDGWHPDVVYQVSLREGLTDLRNNQLETGQVVVFSTGGEIVETQISGSVVDWEQGRIAPNALVEAIRLPDSLTYIAMADSVGHFDLLLVPPGSYHLRAGLDANNNQQLDRREAYDSTTVRLDSTLAYDFWTFAHDTLGPRVEEISLLDSVSIAFVFDQMLALDTLDADDFTVFELPDSTPVSVDRVFLRTEFDSIQVILLEAQRAAADSAAADSLAALADSIGAADSTAVDSLAQDLVPELPVSLGPTPSLDSIDIELIEPDTSFVTQLLAQRPALQAEIVIVTTEPLKPDTRYWIQSVVRNLLGLARQSGRVLHVPATVEPDST